MSWFSDVIDNTVDTVNKAWEDVKDELKRSDAAKAGFVALAPWASQFFAYESLKGFAEEATDWAKAHSGYNKINNELDNNIWLKAGVGVMFAPLGAMWAYPEGQKALYPYAYKTGKWLGELYQRNDSNLPMLITAGMVFPQAVITAYATDEASGGAISDAFVDSFMAEPVELIDPLEWNYYPDQYDAYKWFPGSFEWNAAGAGGALYNSTGVIEPWEKMNNRKQKTDTTGWLADNFYDFNMELIHPIPAPAHPSQI